MRTSSTVFARIAPLLTLILIASDLSAFKIIDYWSPRNKERPVRKRPHFIILHTTEAPTRSALNKLKENGETHYFVDNNGDVYRVIEKTRIAMHCGRSMWDGLSNIDEYSIGIEVAGYHNRDITPAQYATLRKVLMELQQIYKIPDIRVLSHSMVAYGAPNRWHRRSHRGRKRCGMLFGRESVRQKLGLNAKPAVDPDVKAGRLVVADPLLAKVLYGSTGDLPALAGERAEPGGNIIGPGRSAWDVARDQYNDAGTVYVFPNGKRIRGNEIRDWKTILAGTQVILDEDERENSPDGVKELGRDGDTAQEIAGEEYSSPTTYYFFPDGNVRRGNELKDADFKSLPRSTRVLVGYTGGEAVTAKRSAFDICGKRWNYPSTCYRLPDGTLKPGNEIKESAILKGTLIFYRN